MLHADVGQESSDPVMLQYDNQSSIALTKNPRFYGRNKQVDNIHHFVREKIAPSLISWKNQTRRDTASIIL
jgi:hypothetical protein